MKYLLLIAGLLVNSVYANDKAYVCQQPTRDSIAPKITSNVAINANLNPNAGNLPSEANIEIYNHTASMTLYEGSRKLILMSFFFKKIKLNTWELSLRLINDNGKPYYYLDHPISFNDNGGINSESILEVIHNGLPITIDMSLLTQVDNNFYVTCLSQDGWTSLETWYEEDSLLAIPALKVNTNEYYYVDLVRELDNSFQIRHIEAREYSFEDEEHTPYYDVENNIVFIPSLVNTRNNKRYSLELHRNDNGYFDVVNLIALACDKNYSEFTSECIK